MTKTEKIIEQIVFTHKSIGVPMTISDLTRRYNEVLESHGQIKANEALQYHLKDGKARSKKVENALLTKVKYEAMEVFHCIPTALRDIKANIAGGLYKDLPSAQEYIVKFTHHQWNT